MKHLIIKVTLFLIPILIFLTGYEIIMRNIENDYSYKNKWLTNNGHEVELLAIGSSHCICGIDSHLFELKSFNAGHTSQSIKYDYLVLNKFITKMASLKYLLITIGYPELYYDIDNIPEQRILIPNYAIYYDLPINKLRYSLEICRGIDFEAVISYLLKGKTLKECDDLGWVKRLSNSEEPFFDNAEYKLKKHTVSNYEREMQKIAYDTFDNNLLYLNKIISLCNERDIKFVILSTPMNQHYRENVDKVQWQATMDLCNQLSCQYDNVEYLNMFDDSRFDDKDFYDADHLNCCGAIKLSTILNDYIQSQFKN